MILKQAIYREFRPKDFTRVVGQAHIVEILKNLQILQNNEIFAKKGMIG